MPIEDRVTGSCRMLERRKENLNDDKGRTEMRQEPGREMLGKAPCLASTAPNWNEMRALP